MLWAFVHGRKITAKMAFFVNVNVVGMVPKITTVSWRDNELLLS